jgi:thioredoxin reductase
MNRFDVVIIGAGAAGLNAALVLLRARRTVAVVDAGAPRNASAGRMHGFIGRDGTPPRDLLREGRAEIARYGGVIFDDTVAELSHGFHARLAGGITLTGRRVVAAVGLTDELPDIPGVQDRWGRDLLHCPYCHGFEVRDQPLAVLGGSPEAVQHALLIRQWSADLILFSDTDHLTPEQEELLTARGVRVVTGAVTGLVVQDDTLRGVALADGTVTARSAVFVRPRPVPNSRLLVELGCDADENGWVLHDPTGLTSLPGVWIAGNAADPRAQVVTAAGQGSAAAIAVNADLVAEDTARDLADHRAHAAA